MYQKSTGADDLSGTSVVYPRKRGLPQEEDKECLTDEFEKK